MNDTATFALVQWANSLKGKELQKLPEVVREAVIYEQERMEKHRLESKRDNDIIDRFPKGSTFEDHLGRQCTVERHVIDRDGYGVDASITGVGMGYFHSSQLAEFNTELAQKQQRQEKKSENTNTKGDNMNDASLKAGYAAAQQRIEQLESWIESAIARPSMSRELRLQGLELVEAQRPDIRLAVERICPSQSREMGRELQIEM